MPFYSSTNCTKCGEVFTDKTLLMTKTVSFAPVGARGRIDRSRVIARLCRDCLANDPEYNREKFIEAPGMKSEGLERVRKLRGTR